MLLNSTLPFPPLLIPILFPFSGYCISVSATTRASLVVVSRQIEENQERILHQGVRESRKEEVGGSDGEKLAKYLELNHSSSK